MKYVKAIPLLCFALLIDGLQAVIAAALSGLTVVFGVTAPAAGAAVGAIVLGIGGSIVGAVTCVFTAGGGCVLAAVSAASAAAAVGAATGGAAGAAAAAAAQPLGVILGFAISISISFTLGSILVLFLQLFGMLDKKAALLTFMGEALPGLDIFPAWTALVIRCLMKKSGVKKLNGSMLAITTTAQSLILPDNGVGNAMRQGTADSMGLMGIDYNEMQAELAQDFPQPDTKRNAAPMQDIKVRPSPSYAKAA